MFPLAANKKSTVTAKRARAVQLYCNENDEERLLRHRIVEKSGHYHHHLLLMENELPLANKTTILKQSILKQCSLIRTKFKGGAAGTAFMDEDEDKSSTSPTSSDDDEEDFDDESLEESSLADEEEEEDAEENAEEREEQEEAVADNHQALAPQPPIKRGKFQLHEKELSSSLTPPRPEEQRVENVVSDDSFEDFVATPVAVVPTTPQPAVTLPSIERPPKKEIPSPPAQQADQPMEDPVDLNDSFETFVPQPVTVPSKLVVSTPTNVVTLPSIVRPSKKELMVPSLPPAQQADQPMEDPVDLNDSFETFVPQPVTVPSKLVVSTPTNVVTLPSIERPPKKEIPSPPAQQADQPMEDPVDLNDSFETFEPTSRTPMSSHPSRDRAPRNKNDVIPTPSMSTPVQQAQSKTQQEPQTTATATPPTTASTPQCPILPTPKRPVGSLAKGKKGDGCGGAGGRSRHAERMTLEKQKSKAQQFAFDPRKMDMREDLVANTQALYSFVSDEVDLRLDRIRNQLETPIAGPDDMSIEEEKMRRLCRIPIHIYNGVPDGKIYSPVTPVYYKSLNEFKDSSRSQQRVVEQEPKPEQEEEQNDDSFENPGFKKQTLPELRDAEKTPLKSSLPPQSPRSPPQTPPSVVSSAGEQEEDDEKEERIDEGTDNESDTDDEEDRRPINRVNAIVVDESKDNLHHHHLSLDDDVGDLVIASDDNLEDHLYKEAKSKNEVKGERKEGAEEEKEKEASAPAPVEDAANINDDLDEVLIEHNGEDVKRLFERADDGGISKAIMGQYTKARLCDDDCDKMDISQAAAVYDALYAPFLQKSDPITDADAFRLEVMRFNWTDPNDAMDEGVRSVQGWFEGYKDCYQGLRSLIRRYEELEKLLTLARDCRTLLENDKKIVVKVDVDDVVGEKKQTPLQEQYKHVHNMKNFLENFRMGDLLREKFHNLYMEPDSQQHHTQESVDKRWKSLKRAFEEDLKLSVDDKICDYCQCYVSTKYSTTVNDRDKYWRFQPPSFLMTKDGRRRKPIICRMCQRDQTKKDPIPQSALVNNFETVPCPDQLACLNVVECMLIERARANMKTCFLRNANDNKRTPMKATNGVLVVLPTEIEATIDHLADTLPSDYQMNIQVRSGWGKKYLVNMPRVIRALRWLKKHNPLYRDIKINKFFKFKLNETIAFEDENMTQADADALIIGINARIECDPETARKAAQQQEQEKEHNDEHATEKKKKKEEEEDDEKKKKAEKNKKKKNKEEEEQEEQEEKEEEEMTSKKKDDEVLGEQKRWLLTQDFAPDYHRDLPMMMEVNNNNNNNHDDVNNNIGDNKDDEKTENDKNNIGEVEAQPVQRVIEKPFSNALGHQRYSMKKWFWCPLSVDTPNLDCLIFPRLHPTGSDGLTATRRRKVDPAKYVRTRLRSTDRRFARSAQYLCYQYGRKQQLLLMAIQGVQARIRPGLEKQEMDLNDERTQKKLNSAFSKARGYAQYWKSVKYRLRSHVAMFGPPTWYLTLNPNPKKWTDLHELYTMIMPEIEGGVNANNIEQMIAKEPLIFSRYWQARMNSFWRNVLLVEDGPLGTITHHFRRVEYQHKGTQHVHCLLWTNDRPAVGAPAKEVVQFLDRYITARMPDAEKEPKMHGLVKDNQMHRKTHTNTCRRPVFFNNRFRASKCRFGFPRPALRRTIFYTDERRSKVPGITNRPYFLARRHGEEQHVNDYNPAILEQWGANVDLQFISADSDHVTNYVTAYTTKGEKSRQRADHKFDPKKYTYYGHSKSKVLFNMGLRMTENRQVGLLEIVDDLMGHDNFTFDTSHVFIANDPQNLRMRILRPLKELKNATDCVHHNSWADNYYPHRHPDLENYSLYNVITNFEIATEKKDSQTRRRRPMGDEDFSQRGSQGRPRGSQGRPRGRGRANQSGTSSTQIDDEEDPDEDNENECRDNKEGEKEEKEDMIDTSKRDTRYHRACQDSPFYDHSINMADGDKIGFDTPGRYPKKFMRKIKQKIGRFYLPRLLSEDDDYINVEDYYRRLVLMFVPWRIESEILESNGCVSYKQVYDKYVYRLQRHRPSHGYDDLTTLMESYMNLQIKENEMADRLHLARIAEENAFALHNNSQEYDEENDEIGVPGARKSLKIQKREVEATKHQTNVDSLNQIQRDLFDKVMAALETQELIREKNKEVEAENLRRQESNKLKRYPDKEPMVQLHEMTNLIRFIVSGEAGTGKSFFINTLADAITLRYVDSKVSDSGLKPAVVIGAPTGLAALMINGNTLHSLLGLEVIPKGHHRANDAFDGLKNEKLEEIKHLFENVRLIIIDEISMVSNVTLMKISLRLKQLNVNTRDEAFGMFNILVFGDLMQLPPVNNSQPFMDVDKADFDRYFGSIGMDINLWSLFHYVEFTENMRQENDQVLAGLLRRLRHGGHTKDDILKLLERRIAADRSSSGVVEPTMRDIAVYFEALRKTDPRAMALFPTNVEVHTFNLIVLRMIRNEANVVAAEAKRAAKEANEAMMMAMKEAKEGEEKREKEKKGKEEGDEKEKDAAAEDKMKKLTEAAETAAANAERVSNLVTVHALDQEDHRAMRWLQRRQTKKNQLSRPWQSKDGSIRAKETCSKNDLKRVHSTTLTTRITTTSVIPDCTTNNANMQNQENGKMDRNDEEDEIGFDLCPDGSIKNANLHGGLPQTVTFVVGSRVMLRRNISIRKSLVNGATGTVKEIVFKTVASDDLINSPSASDVDYLMIDFDNIYAGGDRSQPLTHKVERMRARFVENGVIMVRQQFPIVLAYGATVHKAQGLTLSNVLIRSRHMFAPGQFYVACSRVTSIDGLHLAGCHPEKITTDLAALNETNRLRGTIKLPELLRGPLFIPQDAKGRLLMGSTTATSIIAATAVVAAAIADSADEDKSSSGGDGSAEKKESKRGRPRRQPPPQPSSPSLSRAVENVKKRNKRARAIAGKRGDRGEDGRMRDWVLPTKDSFRRRGEGPTPVAEQETQIRDIQDLFINSSKQKKKKKEKPEKNEDDKGVVVGCSGQEQQQREEDEKEKEEEEEEEKEEEEEEEEEADDVDKNSSTSSSSGEHSSSSYKNNDSSSSSSSSSSLSTQQQKQSQKRPRQKQMKQQKGSQQEIRQRQTRVAYKLRHTVGDIYQQVPLSLCHHSSISTPDDYQCESVLLALNYLLTMMELVNAKILQSKYSGSATISATDTSSRPADAMGYLDLCSCIAGEQTNVLALHSRCREQQIVNNNSSNIESIVDFVFKKILPPNISQLFTRTCHMTTECTVCKDIQLDKNYQRSIIWLDQSESKGNFKAILNKKFESWSKCENRKCSVEVKHETDRRGRILAPTKCNGTLRRKCGVGNGAEYLIVGHATGGDQTSYTLSTSDPMTIENNMYRFLLVGVIRMRPMGIVEAWYRSPVLGSNETGLGGVKKERRGGGWLYTNSGAETIFEVQDVLSHNNISFTVWVEKPKERLTAAEKLKMEQREREPDHFDSDYYQDENEANDEQQQQQKLDDERKQDEKEKEAEGAAAESDVTNPNPSQSSYYDRKTHRRKVAELFRNPPPPLVTPFSSSNSTKTSSTSSPLTPTTTATPIPKPRTTKMDDKAISSSLVHQQQKLERPPALPEYDEENTRSYLLLENLNTNCFLNSAVNMIFRCRPLRNQILRTITTPPPEQGITSFLRDILNGTTSKVDQLRLQLPETFNELDRKTGKPREHDAAECLLALISLIELEGGPMEAVLKESLTRKFERVENCSNDSCRIKNERHEPYENMVQFMMINRTDEFNKLFDEAFVSGTSSLDYCSECETGKLKQEKTLRRFDETVSFGPYQIVSVLYADNRAAYAELGLLYEEPRFYNFAARNPVTMYGVKWELIAFIEYETLFDDYGNLIMRHYTSWMKQDHTSRWFNISDSQVRNEFTNYSVDLDNKKTPILVFRRILDDQIKSCCSPMTEMLLKEGQKEKLDDSRKSPNNLYHYEDDYDNFCTSSPTRLDNENKKEEKEQKQKEDEKVEEAAEKTEEKRREPEFPEFETCLRLSNLNGTDSFLNAAVNMLYNCLRQEIVDMKTPPPPLTAAGSASNNTRKRVCDEIRRLFDGSKCDVKKLRKLLPFKYNQQKLTTATTTTTTEAAADAAKDQSEDETEEVKEVEEKCGNLLEADAAECLEDLLNMLKTYGVDVRSIEKTFVTHRRCSFQDCYLNTNMETSSATCRQPFTNLVLTKSDVFQFLIQESHDTSQQCHHCKIKEIERAEKEGRGVDVENLDARRIGFLRKVTEVKSVGDLHVVLIRRSEHRIFSFSASERYSMFDHTWELVAFIEYQHNTAAANDSFADDVKVNQYSSWTKQTAAKSDNNMWIHMCNETLIETVHADMINFSDIEISALIFQKIFAKDSHRQDVMKSVSSLSPSSSRSMLVTTTPPVKRRSTSFFFTFKPPLSPTTIAITSQTLSPPKSPTSSSFTSPQRKKPKHKSMMIEDQENMSNMLLLRNRENDCFLNVCVSLLYTIVPFRERYLKMRHRLQNANRELAELFARNSPNVGSLRTELDAKFHEGEHDLVSAFANLLLKLCPRLHDEKSSSTYQGVEEKEGRGGGVGEIEDEDLREFVSNVQILKSCYTGCYNKETGGTDSFLPFTLAFMTREVNDFDQMIKESIRGRRIWCPRCLNEEMLLEKTRVTNAAPYHFVSIEQGTLTSRFTDFDVSKPVEMHSEFWYLMAFGEFRPPNHYRTWVKEERAGKRQEQQKQEKEEEEEEGVEGGADVINSEAMWICISDDHILKKVPSSHLNLKHVPVRLMLFSKVVDTAEKNALKAREEEKTIKWVKSLRMPNTILTTTTKNTGNHQDKDVVTISSPPSKKKPPLAGISSLSSLSGVKEKKNEKKEKEEEEEQHDSSIEIIEVKIGKEKGNEKKKIKKENTALTQNTSIILGNSQLSEPIRWKRYLKLRNVNNSCFVSVALNMLYACSDIRRDLVRCPGRENSDGNRLRKLILPIFLGTLNNTIQLRAAMKGYEKGEKDCGSALAYLLRTLYTNENRELWQSIKVGTRKVTYCNSCQKETVQTQQEAKYDKFVEIPMRMQDISFQAAWDDRWNLPRAVRCEHCNGKKTAEVRTMIDDELTGEYIIVLMDRLRRDFSEKILHFDRNGSFALTTDTRDKKRSLLWKVQAFSEYNPPAKVGLVAHYKSWVANAKEETGWNCINDNIKEEQRLIRNKMVESMTIIVFKRLRADRVHN